MSTDYRALVEGYFASPRVVEAFNLIESSRGELVEEWKRCASIYAPSGSEGPRAEYLISKFREYGVKEAYIDAAGNAVARFASGRPGPTTVFLVTMDDLKPVAELVKARTVPVEERDGKLVGAGTNIGAICATGLALAMLFARGGFAGTVYVVGCTQEETGLTGTKAFLADHPETTYLVDIMGGYGNISYGALCIRWMRVHFRGPKAHTLEGPGPNVTKGVAKSVPRVFAIPLPPDSFLNVSMLGGGTVFNHRGDDGWHSVDLRSLEQPAVDRITEEIKRIASEVAAEEGLESWIETYQDTRGGQIPGARDSLLTRVTEEAARALGKEPKLSNRGSSNMNAGIASRILSVSTGGDRGGRREYPDEYANIEPIFKGMRLNYLIGYILGGGEKS